jgi:glycerate-2-kinase
MYIHMFAPEAFRTVVRVAVPHHEKTALLADKVLLFPLEFLCRCHLFVILNSMAHSIQNFEELAENDLRRDALEIAEAGYEAINVGAAIGRKLRIENGELYIEDKTFPLTGRRIFFVGIGKCAFVAAGAIEKLLGDTLTGGIALGANVQHPVLDTIEALVGTHPLPSEENESATKRIFEFLSGLRAEDLVIFLISGGGSTLLCSYDAPMTSDDESKLFQELTAKGASIQDMNTVRKHTSRARGGGLARAAYPAEVISLIISDVPGNDIQFISSGPTVQDTSTVADAEAILQKYSITPPTNIAFIETPKEEKYFERVANILFLTSKDALSAMQDEAVQRGYATEIVGEQFTGEASDIGRAVVAKLHEVPAKTALLYSGESTVTLGASSGTGGRNQEMALAALAAIRDDELILPLASDGHDNTDSAGTIADATSIAHARAKNLSAEEYLSAHRSYDFFTATGDALSTGYTGSNVSDLIIALKN